ncbi:tetratricopeptide repeat protein, partial [Actinophytocola sp. KF-1]
ESTAARADLYRSSVDGTRTLVVLDNAASEDQVEPLLGATLTIVTGRVQGAVPAAEHIRLEPLPPHEAIELFRKLVTAERVHDAFDQVREIVALCGHVPLLIHLVAAQFQRHTRWPLAHLLDLLRTTPPTSLHARPFEAVATTMAVSYDQLTTLQQSVFRVLALAPGVDISAPAAAALAGDHMTTIAEVLDHLQRVSLLEESAPERFQLLDPVRDYVLATHPAEDHVEAIDRLLDFYLVSTAAAVTTLYPFDRNRPEVTATSRAAMSFSGYESAMSWLDHERRNLVAAIRHAADHGRPEHAWQLAVLLWRYFNVRGHLRDWNETLSRAAHVVAGNTLGLAHVWLRLSAARRTSGALTEARVLAEQALPLWIELGDVRGEAATLTEIATNAYMTGDFTGASTTLNIAVARFEQIGDRLGQAHALDLSGLVNERRGDLSSAERQHLAATGILRELGHQPGLAHSLNNLGAIRQRLGLLDAALANHTEAHELAVELGDHASEAYALNDLGNTHRLAGRLDEAVDYQQRARVVADLIVDPNLRTQLYFDRGETARAMGDHNAALHCFRAALDISSGTGDRAQRARSNHRIAIVLHETDRHISTVWRDAMTEFDELGSAEADGIRAELGRLTCECADAR